MLVLPCLSFLVTNKVVFVEARATVTIEWLLDIALFPPSQSKTSRCPGWLEMATTSIPDNA